MCSISRDPRREEYTICTAVAPDAVFTVRTYGTGPLYDPGLVRKSSLPANQNPQVSEPHTAQTAEPVTSQVIAGMREWLARQRVMRAIACWIMPGGRYSLCRTRAERFRVAALPGSTAINAAAASQLAAMTDSTASGTAVTGVMPS